jgi:hypothetical protein
MFKNAVQQVTGSSSLTRVTPSQSSQVVEVSLDDPGENPPEPPAAEKTAVEDASESEKRRKGFAGFVLEVWLWLQFVLIILVFIWAMARRGPRNVLEADRKRA